MYNIEYPMHSNFSDFYLYTYIMISHNEFRFLPSSYITLKCSEKQRPKRNYSNKGPENLYTVKNMQFCTFKNYNMAPIQNTKKLVGFGCNLLWEIHR
jgi:hypothetical protein